MSLALILSPLVSPLIFVKRNLIVILATGGNQCPLPVSSSYLIRYQLKSNDVLQIKNEFYLKLLIIEMLKKLRFRIIYKTLSTRIDIQEQVR